MNISLILTKQCNLRCRYCFETHESVYMSEETALRAIDMAVKDSQTTVGVSFFGGEPLLCKSLIYKCVDYSKRFDEVKFNWNMTTNGLLLDDEFLQFAGENHIVIAMSHDGLMSRVNRLHSGGEDCLEELDHRLRQLLRYQPSAFIMATTTPETVHMVAESAQYLFEMGVRRLNLAIDSRPDVGWDETNMDLLSEQLGKVGNYIFERFQEGKDICFNPFEEKILAITKDKACHICQLGMRKPYIDWDGSVYPCIQFGGIEEYRMGSVYEGINPVRREAIYQKSLQKPEFCGGCALQKRCINDCACINYQQCGEMSQVSGQQCAFQRMLIEKADEMARKMLGADEKHFAARYLRICGLRNCSKIKEEESQ